MEYLAGSVMSSELIAISEDQNIEVAEILMKTNRIRHLPVVNSDNRLSGIISAKDVAKSQDKKMPISSVMRTNVRMVERSDSVRDVIEMMLKFKINSLLIMHQKEVVGIVTTDDLLKLLSMVIDEIEKSDEQTIETSFFDETWSTMV